MGLQEVNTRCSKQPPRIFILEQSLPLESGLLSPFSSSFLYSFTAYKFTLI